MGWGYNAVPVSPLAESHWDVCAALVDDYRVRVWGGVMSYTDRLRADLARPGGGWTTGLVTILLALAGPLVGLATVQWVGTVWMVAFLIIHMRWGAYGYYPNHISGR